MQKQLSILCKIEMAFFFENGKIDDALTDRDADARRTVARFENSEGKILDWKVRLARDVDKRFERHLAVAALYERRINLSDGHRSPLQEIQGAQIFAWFVKTAASERSYEFSPIFQPFDVDFPFMPGEEFIVEGK